MVWPAWMRHQPLPSTATPASIFSERQEPRLMSDPVLAAPSAPVSAAQAPLDLTSFRAVGNPPGIDPGFRRLLLVIGAQVSMQLVRIGMTPEEAASKAGLTPELLYDLMTGREPDVGLQALSALARQLGGEFQCQIAVKPDPQPPAA